MAKFTIPLVIFILLVALLGFGLSNDPRYVPSPLVGKPAPEFTQPQLYDGTKTFSPAQLKGQVWLLNVWASWCGACRQEHPLLVQLARQNVVILVGLNYKDTEADAKNWLKQLEDPYQIIVTDKKGKVGLDYGVYGVPETFVIDKKGFIRYKQVGPITPTNLQDVLLPLIAKLKQENT